MSLALAILRLQQLLKGMNLRLADVDSSYFQLVSHPNLKMDADGGTNLVRALDSLPKVPQVIIAETFRRLLVGAEKEQEDVSAFWDAVDQIYKAGISLYV